MFLAGHRYAGDEESGCRGGGQDSTLFARLGDGVDLWNLHRDEVVSQRMWAAVVPSFRKWIGDRSSIGK